jgi:hypothetical protein
VQRYAKKRFFYVPLPENKCNNENRKTVVPMQYNDVERQSDSSRMVAHSAKEISYARDRSDIRVFEEGLADEQDGDTGDSTRDRRENVSKRLVEIAKKSNLYISVNEFFRLMERKQKPSGESVVYIDEESSMVYKIKDPYAKSPMKHGVQPEDVIYEHIVHNLLFPESRYTFEGISDVNGEVRIVLSQIFVDSYVKPTKKQIDAEMARRGLKPDGRYSYSNEFVVVTDVSGDNVLLGNNGEFYFIDPIIGFKKSIADILDYLSSMASVTHVAKENPISLTMRLKKFIHGFVYLFRSAIK